MASRIVEEYGDERAAEALQQGIQQGIQQGARQKAIEAAINLLQMKVLSPEQIAQAQDLPVEKILELQAQIKANSSK